MNLRHVTRTAGIAGLSALGLGVGLALSACSPSTSSPGSVTMGVAGTHTTCTGQECLGNTGSGTATGVGLFRCESATTGVTYVPVACQNGAETIDTEQ
jgi:hypothetical protein